MHSEDGRDPAPRKGSCGVAVETGGKGNPDGAGPSKEAVEECPPYLHEHPDLLAWWRRLMASGDIRLGDDGGFKGTGKKAAELHRAIEERRAAAALAGATVSDNGARP